MYFIKKDVIFNSFIYFSTILKQAYGSIEWLNNWGEGFIQHEQQTSGREKLWHSCH